jgi:anaerobic selenocysteine-containing dehydrogenase
VLRRASRNLDDMSTAHVVNGTCHHDCPDSCGWQVTVDGAQAVQLRGNPAHPYSKGELCPKVNRFLDRVYSPDRVLHPLRRVGAKGDGRFEQITWDEALAEIAQRWQGIIAEHGAEAIMPYVSAGNQGLLALFYGDRFWNHMGATRVGGALCGAVAGAGSASTNGDGRGMDPVDVVHSKLVILWGTNTRLTNRHLWPFVEQARAAGAQIVVIDPVRTMTAESADWHLQPLPGTDVALMLAMMHVLIRDGLVDHDWVAQHTVGFDDLAAHVAEWTPQRAAAVCGIDAGEIERLAAMYGTIRPAAIRTLIGAEHHEHGAMFFRTLTCLPALVGAWRERGGGYARSVGVWSETLTDVGALSRVDLLAGRKPRTVMMPSLGDVLLDDTMAPRIHSIAMIGVNALVSVPGAEKVRRGLMRDDLFTVVHDQFLTDTARYADIVLPATTQIEATEVVPSWGSLYVGWNEPAIAPLGEAVSNSELHRRLARAMGYTEPLLFESDHDALRAALPDVDIAELRREGWVRATAYPADGRPFANGGFATASGKVELRSDRLAAQGHPALPTYVPGNETPDSALAERFPLVLLTPKQHNRFLNSSYTHLPKHGPLEGGPYVEMVAADAARYGLVDGGTAQVWNDRATLQLPVRVTQRLREGVVAVPWGWWSADHPDGLVANSLTNDTLTDWGGGVAYSDTLVAIGPA